jgi:glycogen phosphorylase
VTTPDTLRSQLLHLASNLRWAWHRPTAELLRELAGELWEATGRNPLEAMRSLPDERLAELAGDEAWSSRISSLTDDLDAALTAHSWYAEHGPPLPGPVAYFSAEFALSDNLKTYSGGLGVLAGDHLRSASDLGLPLIAVGLAYHQGYFRQTIDGDGRQQHHLATNHFEHQPATEVTDEGGRRLTVEVPMGDGVVTAQAWRIDIGRVPLYLLDTDVEGNEPHHRDITDQLYGGDEELRLRQELVLGVGGVRLLDALGIEPAVFHLNEGHAALAGLARLGVHRDGDAPLDASRDAVRRELVFTTHTPVPAGHDTFGWDLARYHLEPFTHSLGMSFEGAWELATRDHGDRWNQTVLALRLAGRTNGVAKLHGAVSRAMFADLWQDRTVDEVPIDHVTNGVHPTSWVGPDVAELLDAHAPGWSSDRDLTDLESVRDIDPAALWKAHERARSRLIDEARARLDWQAHREGIAPDGRGLDPGILTIGFARRFATYKRGTLLATDVDRLARIVADEDRPVQILIAGKAHPADQGGQQLIADLVWLSRDPRLMGRLAVLEGYDLELGGLLTAGCDVWLNNPLRPMEASGTSGMKAAMNGGLNLSVLDGWWDEAVADLAGSADAGFGWVIGDDRVLDDRAEQDGRDADSLYRVLADQVVPLFYDRDRDGLPHGWLAMMLDAIRVLSPRFSSHRMVVDYADRYAADVVHQ